MKYTLEYVLSKLGNFEVSELLFLQAYLFSLFIDVHIDQVINFPVLILNNFDISPVY
jgi:hypothetical protein